jgi:hypothetical protein
MAPRGWRREYWYWVLLIAAVVLVGYMFLRSSGPAGGQFGQIGKELGEVRQGAARVGDYEFVADTSTKQYWPNKPRYVNAIARENRVYILDGETLKQFAGYRPGPK